ELATVAPGWLRRVVSKDWYGRYARRVEDGRLPRAEAEREAYARTVGEDGFALLDRLDRPETPEELRRLPAVGVLGGSGRASSCARMGRRPAAACAGAARTSRSPPGTRSGPRTIPRRATAPA